MASSQLRRAGNLFADAQPPASGERFDVLVSHRNVVVERIVSSTRIAHETYVQPQDEWVVLLRGQATLVCGGTALDMNAGDYVFIPAGVAHTVSAVSEGALWLAVHLHSAENAPAPQRATSQPL